MGGGARNDIESLILLRPLAVLICGVALATLNRRHIRDHRFLLGFAAALFLVCLLHLVPLPPSVWTSLPGREFIVEIERNAQIEGTWRPLSLVPSATWNALFSLFVPLGALLLAVQLSPEQRERLLPLFLILGMASGLMGLLQVVGDPEGPLYLYRVTNSGAAVGFFANRNHQAIFLACLIPMLAVYASRPASTFEQIRLRFIVGAAAILVLIPFLLVTGSRAGIILGLLGLVSTPFLYRRPAVEHASRPARLGPGVIGAGLLGVAALGMLTILFGRAEAFNRLMAVGAGSEDNRSLFWRPVADMAWQYFPLGSGVGAFEDVYKIGEPDSLLSINYLNHAHNDWLEVVMTVGVPGMILLAAAAVAWAVGTWRAWRGPGGSSSRRSHARLGSVCLLMLGLASVGDYPLRAPFLACFGVVLAVWLHDATRAQARGPAGK